MLKDPISSKTLNLSFDFKVISFKERTIIIEIKGMLRKLEYSESYFGWFMEDLVDFLVKNKFQRRWDIGVIKLKDLKKLGLDVENLKDFKSKFKTVTSWDMEEENENSI